MSEKLSEVSVIPDFENIDVEDFLVRDAIYESNMRKKFPANQLLTNNDPDVVHYDLYKMGARTQPKPARSEGHNVFWPDNS